MRTCGLGEVNDGGDAMSFHQILWEKQGARNSFGKFDTAAESDVETMEFNFTAAHHFGRAGGEFFESLLGGGILEVEHVVEGDGKIDLEAALFRGDFERVAGKRGGGIQIFLDHFPDAGLATVRRGGGEGHRDLDSRRSGGVGVDPDFLVGVQARGKG